MSDLSSIHEISISSKSRKFSTSGFRVLWQYKELLYFLVWRDVKVRYKQTVIGVAWAIIQPLLAMIVFTLFFGKLAKMPSDGIPYPIFSYAALVPWVFFANALNQCSESLVRSADIIKKIYFPRLAIPLSSVFSGVIDFSLSLLILFIIMPIFGVVPGIEILWLPFFILLAIITSFGVGLWLATLNVIFRDVRYAVPFMIQLWLFASPVVYPSSLLPEPWRSIYGINPMSGVVEGFRWALLGTENPPVMMLILSVFVSLALLISGIVFFGRIERKMADII